MPSERPTRPRPTNSSMNSAAPPAARRTRRRSPAGRASAASPDRPRGAPGRRRCRRGCPTSRSIVWRRSCSPIRAACMRSTSEVALQVRDQAGHVREPGEVGDGAALVVDEHERELLGGVRGVRPATSERSSSLLPEPLAPTSTPCGPTASAACLGRARAPRRRRPVSARAAPLRACGRGCRAWVSASSTEERRR